ncbi:hypothetical protein [Actinomadura craniellae]|uniref:hypothetical protein n=1 Tax=Actinomadura craniellae TaxID=2231787 RepID=UPI0018F120B3|nr:hypothetical protein [Actinomadura craniellae]
MSFQISALLLSWTAILLLSLVVAGLVRQVHALGSGGRPATLGPPPGGSAPAFDRLGPGLLLFLDADCGSCPEVLAAAERIDGTPVRAIFAGPAPVAGIPVLAGEPELFDAYRIPATPFAVVVGGTGRVLGAEPVGSPAALRSFLDRVRARETAPSAAGVPG